MTILGGILIDDPQWIVPAAVLVAAGLALVAWGYRHSTVATRVRVIGGGLKLAAFLALAATLVNPLWSGVRARPGANLFLLVADNSQSLNIRDKDASRTRADELQRLLASEKARWRTRLGQDFDVRHYVIGSRLESVESYEKLAFDSPSSALVTGLKELAERFRDRPVAGILMFTDGNATDLDEGTFDLEGVPPVYAVPLGRSEPVPDLSIENVAVTQTAFEDAPIAVQADVRAVGFRGTNLTAQLLDEQGKLLEEVSIVADEPSTLLAFRFQVRPPKPGISFYEVRVGTADEMKAESGPASEQEATPANNSRLIAVDRGTGPYRVLYVSGRPNWEFKFLRRALDEDEQVELMGLIRIANREPKFDFLSRSDERSNPLYRGFKGEPDEETERYDQPVLVRLNTRDDQELRDGFPKAEKDLYGFHALILDDLEASFFTEDQLTLLEKFVSERGGGLLMLGGQESFRNGGYDRTALGRLLPVYIDRATAAGRTDTYRLKLTRDGWLQPWVRLRGTETEEQERLKQMPVFRTLNQVGNLKPGGTVLAEVTDSGGTSHPALVAQSFGRGRTAALAIGDMWRWDIRRTDEQREQGDLGKAWRQMLRWLVADVPDRVDFEIDASAAQAPGALTLATRVLSPEYRPLDNASVALSVVTPDGATAQLTAEPSLKEGGLYTTTFLPRQPGRYRATATVTDERGEKVGTAETGWASNPAADEYKSITPNRGLLEQISADTGGEVVELDQLAEFAEGLPNRKVPVTEQWTYPLWHQSWVFLLAIGCLVGEWGLRRWKGLA